MDINNDDFIIEDIVNNSKKRIKSGKKGKRGEGGVVSRLNKRFINILSEHPNWGGFSRTEGSGNRLSQVQLSETAKQVYVSDLVCPDHCLWAIEVKNGYDDIELFTCFKGKCGQLDGFFDQVTRDSNKVNRKPLLIWKKTRMPYVAFFHANLVEDAQFSTRLYYKKWVGVLLEELLQQTTDDFWFEL